MKWVVSVGIGACLAWAQSRVWAETEVRGDFVEVAVFWKGTNGMIPLGANFVMVAQPSAPLGWEELRVIQRGARDALSSPYYREMYLTHRGEETQAHRVSLNLLAQTPPQGTPFVGQPEFVGRWRVPIRTFGDTLYLRWGMETGEIVLAPFLRARDRFSFDPIPPVRLCPEVSPARLISQGGTLTLQLPGEFRPENLSITWYRDGIQVGQQSLEIEPPLPGRYWAEIAHVCGTEAFSDTVEWRINSVQASTHQRWRLYPQPSTGEVWIEAPQSGTVLFVLRDPSGREVYRTSYMATVGQAYKLILPPTVSAGLYQLLLSNNNEVIALPFSYAK